MPRIIRYDFRKSPKGRKLILWQALERGQRAVLGSVQLDGDAKPEDLVLHQDTLVLMPVKVRRLSSDSPPFHIGSNPEAPDGN